MPYAYPKRIKYCGKMEENVTDNISIIQRPKWLSAWYANCETD